MYDILIDYRTGDSFGSEEIVDESTGFVTKSLDTAKENLRRIAEHYKKYHDNYDYDADDRFSLELLTDSGVRSINPFWLGYFETLHEARIVSIECDDLTFRPDES